MALVRVAPIAPSRSLASAASSPTLNIDQYWKIWDTFGQNAAAKAWAVAYPGTRAPTERHPTAGGPTASSDSAAPLQGVKSSFAYDNRPAGGDSTGRVPSVHYNIPLYTGPQYQGPTPVGEDPPSIVPTFRPPPLSRPGIYFGGGGGVRTDANTGAFGTGRPGVDIPYTPPKGGKSGKGAKLPPNVLLPGGESLGGITSLSQLTDIANQYGLVPDNPLSLAAGATTSTNDGSSTDPPAAGSASTTTVDTSANGQLYKTILGLANSLAGRQTSLTPKQIAAAAKTAAQEVASALNPKVTEAQNERNAYVQEAQQRATAVMAAYRAMANMSQGDAANIQNAYRTASSDMSAAAAGFTGSMAPSAAAQEAQIQQRTLGTATTPAGAAQALGPVAGAASALNTMQGIIPADLFAREAARNYTAALAQPKGIMGTGIQAMQMAQHASDAQELALNKQIQQYRAQAPQLTQTALTSLLKQAQSALDAGNKQAAATVKTKIDTLLKLRTGDQGDIRLANQEQRYKDLMQVALGNQDLNWFKARWGQQVDIDKSGISHSRADAYINSLKQLVIDKAKDRALRKWTVTQRKNAAGKTLNPTTVLGIAQKIALGDFNISTNTTGFGGSTMTYTFNQAPAYDFPTAVQMMIDRTGVSPQAAVQLLKTWTDQRRALYAQFSGITPDDINKDSSGSLKNQAKYASYFGSWDPTQVTGGTNTSQGYS